MDALIIGQGISGLSAKRFLEHIGYSIDSIDEKEKDIAEHLLEKKRYSLVILSPGIAPSNPWVQKVKKQGALVIGELELGLRNLKNPAIGITGTNGKTTTTELIAHTLNYNGIKALAVGNNGKPLCEHLIGLDPKVVLVIEISSYQLETAQTPSLDSAAILNITPDHLERYKDFREYMLTKLHIQTLLKHPENFYLTPRCQNQIYEEGFHVQSTLESASFEKEGLEENILAARVLSHNFGIDETQFFQALKAFSKPKHRLELIKKIDGISFYNDSKGTNLDAVMYALKRISPPIILLVGGKHKGYPYQIWKQALADRVKKIVAFGEAQKKIKQDLHPFEVQLVSSLKDAVSFAYEQASEGDSVVLSPGCASFDMYKDYRHRGREFESIIKTLGKNP